MKNPVYYNGVICPFENAAIPLTDRSIFFADAVYDVMIGRGKSVYQFNEHMRRLRGNCERIGLDLAYSDEEIIDIINELAELCPACDFMLYIHISASTQKRAHKRDGSLGNMLITLTEISIPIQPNEVSAILMPDMRYEYCDIKTTNLLPSVLSVMSATERNADIAIFHKNRYVTEASYANVFIIKNDELLTPPISRNLLPGITRENIISTSRKLGIKCAETEITTDDLMSADAVILTSTTKLMQICTKIEKFDISLKANEMIMRIFNALYSDFLSVAE